MKAISLFASGGIGDLALRGSGIEVILANELIKERCEVFKANYPKCDTLSGDIWALQTEIVERTRERLNGEKLDMLLATPPCQGMSKNGRGKLLNEIRKGERPKLDPRNQLIVPTIEIVKNLEPSIVVLENVPEMKNTLIDYMGDLINIIDFIETQLNPLGYVGNAEVVEFADYGVPQRRQRLITIFCKDSKLLKYFNRHFSFLPSSTHSKTPENGKSPWVTVKDAIGSLPKIDAKCKEDSCSSISDFHRVPVLNKDKYYWVSNTPPEQGAFDNQCSSCGYDKNPTHGSTRDKNGVNKASSHTPIRCSKCNDLLPRPWVVVGGEYRLMKGFTSSYRRMKWDLPATALTTNLSYASSDSKLHPDQNRVLSLYEAFIIHTIDRYSFEWRRADGLKTSDKLIREIIGESIPPYGLEKIISHLVQIHKGQKTLLKPQNGQLRLFKEKGEVYK